MGGTALTSLEKSKIGVKNETRKQLICEHTYANWIKIWQCKICFKIFIESNELVDHQLNEHTDKQFEDRF